MNYFLISKPNIDKKQTLIKSRKKRRSIKGVAKMGKIFKAGDILTINFWAKTCRYHFEGLCLGIKKKRLTRPNVTLTLRNVLFGVGVEMQASYYFNRLFKNTYMSDYKRKKFDYRSSKLYYLRIKKNQETKVKA